MRNCPRDFEVRKERKTELLNIETNRLYDFHSNNKVRCKKKRSFHYQKIPLSGQFLSFFQIETRPHRAWKNDKNDRIREFSDNVAITLENRYDSQPH